MVQEAPIGSDISVLRKQEFYLYRVWRQLPFMLRRPPRDSKTLEQPTPREFALAMGIDDDTILELVEIPSQQEFARKYDLSVDTLSDWNKKLDKADTNDDLRVLYSRLTKNLMFSLYNHAMRKGNPLNFKLWLEYVQKWAPNIKIDATYRGVARIVVKPDHERIAAPQQ